MVTRRGMLKGIAALPIATVAPKWSAGEDKKANCDGPHVSGSILNVLFHGPFVFVQRESNGNVEAMMPVVDRHSYGAGTWQEERALDWGTYRLSGIQDQITLQTLTEHESVQIPSELIDIDPDGERYCTFILPKPQITQSLGIFKAQAAKPGAPTLGQQLFTGRHVAHVQKVESLGTVHAFVYSLASSDVPKMEGMNWPSTQPNSLGAINLHIFATSVFEFEDDATAYKHSRRAFRRTVELIPGLSLGLKPMGLNVEYQSPSATPLPGVLGEEQGRLRQSDKCGKGKNKGLPPALCDTPSVFVTGA